jgi:hypothetical protein
MISTTKSTFQHQLHITASLYEVTGKILYTCGSSCLQRIFQTCNDSLCLGKASFHPSSPFHLGTWILEHPSEPLGVTCYPLIALPCPYSNEEYLTYVKKWTMIQTVLSTKWNRVMCIMKYLDQCGLIGLDIGSKTWINSSIPGFYFRPIMRYKSFTLYSPV